MTIDEFNNTAFTGRMKMIYEGKVEKIVSVSFTEKLLSFETNYDEELTWVRCENVQLVEDNK